MLLYNFVCILANVYLHVCAHVRYYEYIYWNLSFCTYFHGEVELLQTACISTIYQPLHLAIILSDFITHLRYHLSIYLPTRQAE